MKGYLVNEVEVRKKEVNFIIWIIPIISLIVGGWLIYKYYSSLGPLITIKFKNSGGLEAKRSVVKFRDVKVGKVESIEILKEGGVLVKVRMDKNIEPFLNYTTKFWVVKPEISFNKVRGLDALLSGPYIQMYAKPKGFTKTFFIGLDNPPLDSEIVNGKVYKLIAKSSYGLEEGLPVYYKDMKVGVIRRVELKNNRVEIYIVIWKRYDKYVNSSTKFWNLKTLNLSLKENKVLAKIPPIKELVFGGIEFETPLKDDKNKTTFTLYSSKEEAFSHRLVGNRFVDLNFTIIGDTSKLQIGDVVKFRGFNVGVVKNLVSFYDFNRDKIITAIRVKFNIGAFNTTLDNLIKKGLVIKLSNSFLGTYLTIDFDKKYKGQIHTEIEKSKLIEKVEKFLDKLNSLPLKKLLNDSDRFINNLSPALQNTLKSINITLGNVNSVMKSTSKNLNNTLINVSKLSIALEKLAKSYDKNSLFYTKVSKTLKDVDKALINFNRVLNKIDKKPNSIIVGD